MENIETDSYSDYLDQQEKRVRCNRAEFLAGNDKELADIAAARRHHESFLLSRRRALGNGTSVTPPTDVIPAAPLPPLDVVTESDRRGLRASGLTRDTYELLSRRPSSKMSVSITTGKAPDPVATTLKRGIDAGDMAVDDAGIYSLTPDGIALLRRSVPYKGDLVFGDNNASEATTAMPVQADTAAAKHEAKNTEVSMVS